jgi:hypothetical protein
MLCSSDQRVIATKTEEATTAETTITITTTEAKILTSPTLGTATKSAPPILA